MPWTIESTHEHNNKFWIKRAKYPPDAANNPPSREEQIGIATVGWNTARGVVATWHPDPPKPDDPPPPDTFEYDNAYEGVNEGALVPFLGAGASASVRGEHEQTWDVGKNFPPTTLELAYLLANGSEYGGAMPYEWSDLARIASHYANKNGPDHLRDRLHKVFKPVSNRTEAEVRNSLHWTIADCPAEHLFVITTNYDTLIEDAFCLKKRAFDVIVEVPESGQVSPPAKNPPPPPGSILVRTVTFDGAQQNFEQASTWGPYRIMTSEDLDSHLESRERSVIYKMHGSVSPNNEPAWGTFVITEEDYLRILARGEAAIISQAIKTYCEGRKFLFLGYSLRDVNFRLILKGALHKAQLTKNHWALMTNPPRVESELWLPRGVRLIDKSLADFSAGFRLQATRARPNP